MMRKNEWRSLERLGFIFNIALYGGMLSLMLGLISALMFVMNDRGEFQELNIIQEMLIGATKYFFIGYALLTISASLCNAIRFHILLRNQSA